MTTQWKYADASGRVVTRVLDDGRVESCVIDAIAEWIAQGNTPLPADPPTQAELDAIAQATADAAAKAQAQADAVIQQLIGIQTLAQCSTFCTNNFPTLTVAERTLMSKIIFALSVLAKRELR
jgi:uncharacterized protein YggE